MFKRKHLHRDMADVNVYTARRLKDMAESLGSLARAFAGEVENGSRLGKEDGLAAMQTAAALVAWGLQPLQPLLGQREGGQLLPLLSAADI